MEFCPPAAKLLIQRLIPWTLAAAAAPNSFNPTAGPTAQSLANIH
jgi:hypothetical protein